MAQALRSRQVRARTLVDAHIERIESWNPHLTAVVADRFERARAEADEADRRLDTSGPHPPLLGVPCTIKEFLAVEGLPHTAGLTVRRGVVADHDAIVVERIRQAGAVIMGVTNGPEGGLWSETVNKVYGRTNNPWNPRHTSGGSSGGEGAIIAVGGSPFGLGSDIGGSVRIPAAHCGIAAHKPTGRLVPNWGHHPPNESPFLVVGPMARRVRDLAMLLPLIAGPDPRDPIAQPLESHAAATSLEGVTVWLPEQGLAACSGPVRQAVEASATALQSAGAIVQSVSLPALDQAFWIWLATLSTSGFQTYAEVLGDGPRTALIPALARSLFGGGQYTIPPLLVALVEELGQRLPLINKDKLVAMGQELGNDLHARLGNGSVLLLPTVPKTAPKHGGSMVRFAENGLCGIFNILGLPATQVPAGRDPKGLPIGVQVVAGQGRDALSLTVAAAIEDALGGWQAPPHPDTQTTPR